MDVGGLVGRGDMLVVFRGFTRAGGRILDLLLLVGMRWVGYLIDSS